MAKKNRISVNAFEEAAALKHDETTDIEWNGLTITVRKRLSLREAMLFAIDVTNACFDDEDGSYNPEYRELIQYKNVIERYTNLTLPQNIERQYELLIGTDIVLKVLCAVDYDQYGEILNDIDAKIEYRKEIEAYGARRRIDEAYNKIVEIADQLGKMFSDVTPEDISKVIGAVADGKIDEHKIVDAYFEKKAEAGEPDGEG